MSFKRSISSIIIYVTDRVNSCIDSVAAKLNIHPITVTAIPLILLSYSTTGPRILFPAYFIWFFLFVLLKKDAKMILFSSMLVALWFQQGKYFMDSLYIPYYNALLYRTAVISPVFIASLLLIILAIFFATRKKDHVISISKIDALLFIMVCFSVLAALVSEYPSIAWIGTWQFISGIFFFWIVRLCAEQKFDYMRIFFELVGLFVITLSIHMVIQYVSGGPLGLVVESAEVWSRYGRPAVENYFSYRPAGIFDDPNLAASLLGIFFPFFLIFSFIKGKVISQRLALLSVISSFIGIILSQSRVVWFFSFFLSCLILIVLRHKLVKKVSLSIAMVSIVCCIAVSIVTMPRLYSLEKVFSSIGSGSYRIEQYKLASQIMSLHPLGIGAAVYPYYVIRHFDIREYRYNPAEPHSIFVQMGSELGIGTLVLFCLFVVRLLYISIQSIIQYKNMLLLSLLIGFVAAVGIGSLYPWLLQPNYGVFLWMLAGLLVYENKKTV